jgi:hypothetical protein
VQWLVVANLAGHLLADFSITVTLACLLRKSRTGFDTCVASPVTFTALADHPSAEWMVF